jgi:hypothetical protein
MLKFSKIYAMLLQKSKSFFRFIKIFNLSLKSSIMATQTPWSFEQNPFLNATTNSFRRAARIDLTHFNAISEQAGTPFFDNLITFYKPPHDEFVAAYAHWIKETNKQQGLTQLVNDLFENLSGEQIRQWDIAIQNVYDINTPNYKGLLPNRRTTFQNANQTDRIAAVAALAENIGSDAALQTLKTAVLAFSVQLTKAIDDQKKAIKATKDASDAVEKARVNICEAQYANLGALMQHFYKSTNGIGQYFDLLSIRRGTQKSFEGETNPLQTKNVFKKTFKPGTKLLIRNDGPTELQFFNAQQKKDTKSGKPLLVAAGQEVTVKVEDVFDLTNSYLNVANPDAVNKGSWTIDFL